MRGVRGEIPVGGKRRRPQKYQGVSQLETHLLWFIERNPTAGTKTSLPTKAVEVPWRASLAEVPSSSSSQGKGGKSSSGSVLVGMW